jgi:hypothetical protein
MHAAMDRMVWLDSPGCIAIEDLRQKAGEEAVPRKRTFRMLLVNLKIVVNGATATTDVVWTGVNSETVKAPPQFVEQG